MADVRYCNCPNIKCQHRNVIGYYIEEKDTKILKAGGIGYGALMGALLAGPIGLVAGITLGKVAGDKIGNLSKEKKYVFKCPSCGEEFTRWYKN